MHSHPPPTPVFPSSRFNDISLLLTEQPIFENDSLGGDDSAWGVDLDDTFSAGPSSKPGSVTPVAPPTSTTPDLDLDAYLPPDDTLGSQTNMNKTPAVRQAEPLHPGLARATSVSSTRSSSISGHRRDGSYGLVSREPLSSKKQHRDDFYSRRMSDSNRRSSGSFHIASPHILSASLSSSSLRRSTSLTFNNEMQDITKPASTSEKGVSQENDWSPEAISGSREGSTNSQEAPAERMTIPKPSALSRYLSKSTVLNSSRLTSHLSPLDPRTDEPTPGPRPDLEGFRRSASFPSSSAIIPISSPPRGKTLEPGLNPPPARQSYGFVGPSPLTTIADLGQASTLAIDEAVGEDISASDNVDQPGSRRTSASERVLGFFASFLQGPSKPVHVDLSPVPRSLAESGVSSLVDKPSANNHKAHRRQPISTFNPNSEPVLLTRPKPFTLSSKSSRSTSNSSRPTSLNVSTRSIAPSKPATKSAFASAALARLPPPGKGSSSSAKPVVLKDAERARDLATKRRAFEGPTVIPPVHSKSGASKAVHSNPRRPLHQIQTTIPISGRTPGKASKARAAEREKFDATVREKMEAREIEKRALERERMLREEEEDRELRKKTVVRANPLPDLYRS